MSKSSNQPSESNQKTKLQKASVVVSATFTVDYMLPSLDFILNSVGLVSEVDVAPYHQVYQQLLDPSSLTSQNTKGVNVFILRLEDFFRDKTQIEHTSTHVDGTVAELLEALSKFTQKMGSPTVVALLPCSPRVTGDLKLRLDAATTTLESQLKHISSLVTISAEDLHRTSFDVVTGYDEMSDELAHVPFSESSFSALALAIARKVHMLRVPARKVLVLDCDNTIWKGVVGEDGVNGITLPPAFLQIQQFAVEAQSQGILICLASKNAEQDVLEVFEKRTDMILKMEHIVSHRINWESKFKNLESLANELNLGIDSFVFFDDNPVECGQMRQALPKVITLQVSPDDEVTSFLEHMWLFDKLAVTEEDTKRTQMYRENSARQKIEDSTTDIASFLASLELVIDIGRPDEDEWPRVAQLTQRTNQFNFTTIRRNEPDMRALALLDGAHVLRVKVRDRFGDYGLVGVTVSRQLEDALQVDTMLLSCRVLGRGVEHAMIRQLGEMAKSANLNRLNLPYVLTPKNEPARAFADNVALTFKVGDESSCVYSIPVNDACQISHLPGGDPEAIIEAKRADGKKKPKIDTSIAEVSVSSSERYENLARTLTSGEAVLTHLRSSGLRQRDLETIAVPAETPIEHELLAIWKELLGMRDLGVEDDYFSIGGTSLIAARLFAEIARRFEVKLRLTTILDAPTVRSLAQYIQPNKAAGASVLVTLKKGSGKTLYLVHDGDGETLLYKNLAERMPEGMQVVGIEPRSIPSVPMAHGSIEEMAAFYIQTIRQKQSHGPYLLGGMCAGGLISYEMGLQLVRAGEVVELVAILDAATPLAPKRIGRIAQDRAKRVSGLKAEARAFNLSGISAWVFIVNTLVKKIFNTLHWELSSRLAKLSVWLRFLVLRYTLSKHKAWPQFLPELTVRNIFNSAEANYHLGSDRKLKALLIRATDGVGDDLPFREIYSEDTLGWRSAVPALVVADVKGGHASMLQEPYVKSLSQVLIGYLNKPIQGK